MGQGQAVGLVLDLTEQQQVDVDQAGRVARPAGLASLLALDLLELVEQIFRAEIGAGPDRRVEEVRLVEDLADRLGSPDRRACFDAQPLGLEPIDRLAQVGNRLADVRAKAEPGLVDQEDAPRLSATSTEAPSMTTGIGGSGLVARTVTRSTVRKRSSMVSPITVTRRSRVR